MTDGIKEISTLRLCAPGLPLNSGFIFGYIFSYTAFPGFYWAAPPSL